MDSFGSKQPYESFYVGFDFANDLGAETIVSAVVTAVDAVSLADVGATLLDASQQAISGAIVYAWVQGGTSGREYVLTCRVTCSLGSEYELDGILPVDEIPAAPAGSTFRDLLDSNLDDVFYTVGEFAVSVIYTRTTGVELAVTAIIDYGQGDEYRGADSYGVRATLRIKSEEITQPARSDEITIGSGRWIVIGAELVDDGREWIVQANKVTA